MAVDVGSAALIGGVSTVLGFGASYLIFKKFVADKYAVGRAQENKIFYWMGFVAMLALGQSLGTIVNEILISISLGSQINADKIFKGLIGAIFFPIIFALFAFLLNKISPSKNKIIKNNPQEDDSTISSIADEYWEKASREFDNERHEATWAKSLASADGDEAKAKGFYLKFRAIYFKNKTINKIESDYNISENDLSKSEKGNLFFPISQIHGLLIFSGVIGTFAVIYAINGGSTMDRKAESFENRNANLNSSINDKNRINNKQYKFKSCKFCNTGSFTPTECHPMYIWTRIIISDNSFKIYGNKNNEVDFEKLFKNCNSNIKNGNEFSCEWSENENGKNVSVSASFYQKTYSLKREQNTGGGSVWRTSYECEAE